MDYCQKRKINKECTYILFTASSVLSLFCSVPLSRIFIYLIFWLHISIHKPHKIFRTFLSFQNKPPNRFRCFLSFQFLSGLPSLTSLLVCLSLSFSSPLSRSLSRSVFINVYIYIYIYIYIYAKGNQGSKL